MLYKSVDTINSILILYINNKYIINYIQWLHEFFFKKVLRFYKSVEKYNNSYTLINLKILFFLKIDFQYVIT